MALNYAEKRELDTIIRGMLDTLCEKQNVSLNDLEQTLAQVFGNTLCYQSIDASLYRITQRNETYGYEYNTTTHCFTFSRGEALDYTNYTFRKERNLLHFGCYPNLTYDFITKQFNIPLVTFKNADKFFKEDIMNTLKYEWMFNYTQSFHVLLNITYNCPRCMYEKMPDGFIEAIKTSADGFSYELLEEFWYISKYKKYAKLARNLAYNLGQERFEQFLKICTLDNLIKLIKNDILNGVINSRGDVCSHMQTILSCFEVFDNSLTLDYNRGLSQNSRSASDILNARKNEILEKRLQKLNFINGLKIGKLVVVVPQNQKDKQDEGRMQNNCVGYHYDNSIMNGKNYIYFLRKADDVEHSYITCRYNVEEKDTVEYRKRNNSSVSDSKEREIIKQVSEIIRKNFE